MIVACGQTQALGQHDADLRKPLVVRLQSGQDEVELLVTDGGGERVGDRQRVGGGQRLTFDMNGPIRTASQRLADDLRHARRPGGAGNDLATVPFLEPQRFFERIGVRLIHLEAGVAVADPDVRLADTQRPFSGDDLFDAHGDLHGVARQPGAGSCELGAGAKGRFLVPSS